MAGGWQYDNEKPGNNLNPNITELNDYDVSVPFDHTF